MALVWTFIAGFIFSTGLVTSQMISPDKVLNFLNIFGNWDPSLLFVMAGAILFNLVPFYFLKKRKKSFCGNEFSWAQKKSIDLKLVFGASLFGLGWGLVGICPGPAILNLLTFAPKAYVFMLSLFIGFILHKILDHYLEKRNHEN